MELGAVDCSRDEVCSFVEWYFFSPKVAVNLIIFFCFFFNFENFIGIHMMRLEKEAIYECKKIRHFLIHFWQKT